MMVDTADDGMTVEQIRQTVASLGPWFHNIDLKGVRTAPDHFLGDYPAFKWQSFRHAIEHDVRGKSVLDVGCNAGFYCFEMKRLGAERVVGIDADESYLAQARFAASVQRIDVEFLHLSVYDVAQLRERFDWVLFMGVFYHLRHPLLALDVLREHAVKAKLVFQSMHRGDGDVVSIEADYPFKDTSPFALPGYPKLHFVEHRYAGDPTNWWIPNRACSEAVLRSAGFRIMSNPEPEVFICEADPSAVPDKVRTEETRRALSGLSGLGHAD